MKGGSDKEEEEERGEEMFPFKTIIIQIHLRVCFACMCTTYVLGGCRGQSSSDTLELELRIVVNHHAGLGTQLGSSARIIHPLNQ